MRLKTLKLKVLARETSQTQAAYCRLLNSLAGRGIRPASLFGAAVLELRLGSRRPSHEDHPHTKNAWRPAHEEIRSGTARRRCVFCATVAAAVGSHACCVCGLHAAVRARAAEMPC